MSSSKHSPAINPGGAFCGNCGKPVSAADVTCPACGVLLAAYQAPAGAAGSQPDATSPVTLPADISIAHEAASPVAPSVPEPATPPPPVIHQPRSQSPIGDALRRAREPGTTGADGPTSDALADELAGMAADDSALAKAVEAELAGARVTFDGNDSVIETDRAEIAHDEAEAPVVAHGTPTPGSRAEATPAPSQAVRPAAPIVPAVESPVVDAASVPEGQRPRSGWLSPAAVAGWLPFVLIGCVMLGVGRSLPGFGGVFGFALVIGLVYVLLRAAAASSRKTTSMPRDTTWNRGRSRRRK